MLRKNLRMSALFLLTAVLSVWAVVALSKDFSLASLFFVLEHSRPGWILMAAVLMPGFIVFEGLALSKLVEGVCGTKSRFRGIVYSAADIYFSAITPSSTGGQPASAIFMHEDGIPAAKTTVILIVNLIMYCYSLLLSGLVALCVGHRVFLRLETGAQVLIGIGFLLIGGLSTAFWLLLRREGIIGAAAGVFLRLAGKLHLVRNADAKGQKLACIMAQYSDCAVQMQGKGKFLLVAFLYNLLQRFSQSLVTVACYLAVGGRLSHILEVWSVQLMANLGAYTIPIPGGMGVTDYLLISGLEVIPDVIDETNMTLISRGISFYGSVLLSLLIFTVARFYRKKRRSAA